MKAALILAAALLAPFPGDAADSPPLAKAWPFVGMWRTVREAGTGGGTVCTLVTKAKPTPYGMTPPAMAARANFTVSIRFDGGRRQFEIASLGTPVQAHPRELRLVVDGGQVAAVAVAGPVHRGDGYSVTTADLPGDLWAAQLAPALDAGHSLTMWVGSAAELVVPIDAFAKVTAELAECLHEEPRAGR